MKKKMLLFIALCFVGLTSANAAPFKIGSAEYDTLVDAIAAVPTNGTKTTIVMTEDYKGPGVEVESGKNVVIDFGGHNYESMAPFVGSPKTRTISFRFMEGATVELKNGHLKASNDTGTTTYEYDNVTYYYRSRMFIQNYANLTTSNLSIDASDNEYDYFYAISNNSGRVYIGDGTSIKVNDSKHARAIDSCWGPAEGYPDGAQVVIETDDEINGYIELDYWSSKDKDTTKYPDVKSTMEIKNIDFHGKWSIDAGLESQLVIDGGRYFNPGISESNKDEYFAAHPEFIDIRDYLKDGNASYNLDEHFYVLPSKHTAYNNEKIFIIKGTEYNFTKNLPVGYEQFVTYEIADESILTIKDGVLKGIADGVTEMTVYLGETKDGRISDTFDVIVFDLDAATDYQPSANEGEAIVNVMSIIVSSVVEKALDDNSNEFIDAETKAKLIAAIEDGQKIDAKIEVKELKESDLDSDLVKKIKSKVSNGTVVEFLDIDLLLTANDDLIGKITKLDDKMRITIDAPDSLKNIPTGTIRKFFIVRTHEGEEPEVIEATLKDGKLIFETDKFSNYAVGYTDTTNPKTGDSIISYVMLFSVSLIALYLVKNKRNA